MRTYIVRAGDTFGGIAKQQGVSIAALKALNPQIKNINWIFVGQTIYLPSLAVVIPSKPVSTPVVRSLGVTSAQLCALVPSLSAVRAAEFVAPLNQTLQEFSIITKARQTMFLAQCAHESGGFRAFVENLNYSAQGLMNTWPQRFPSSIAIQYAHQPERIANRAYANRLGNGDEASGEGWRYRGRGVIQLTGKDNYRMCGQALNADLLGSPELVEQPVFAFRTAGWFWSSRQLNALADVGDFVGITRKINGGLNGFADRQSYLAIARKVFV